MISTHYICNGCGLYTSYRGKNEKQLNEIKIDLTNYLIINAAFIMKEPMVRIHFCDECYSKIIDGELTVRSIGNIVTVKGRKALMELLEKTRNKKQSRA